MANVNLKHVITIVNKNPFKIDIMGEDFDAGTDDPLNQMPYIYKFYGTMLTDNKKKLNFVVILSDDLINKFNGINKDVHFYSIIFGLKMIKLNHEAKKFIFTSTEHDIIIQRDNISGPQLVYEILEFANAVNSEAPLVEMNYEDFQFNITANEDDVKQWTTSLAEEELLLQFKHTIPERYQKGKIGMDFYRINPKKKQDIEKRLLYQEGLEHGTLLEGKKVKLFLSYSTENLEMVKEIRDFLIKEGFKVFVAKYDIPPSEEWMTNILKHIHRCNIFIPLITDSFRSSEFTDQEAGYALASERKIIPLYIREGPHGFLSKIQGINIRDLSVKEICNKIVDSINRLKDSASE